jgi:predicted RNA-binding protein with PIN domain
MALIKDLILPDEILSELYSTIEKIPAGQLVQLAGSDKTFAPGFRISASSIEKLRKRMISMIDSPSPISKSVLQCLRINSFQQKFVCVISELALTDEDGFIALSHFCGGARLLLGMLLDTRKNVVDKALAFIASGKPIPPPPESAEIARTAMDEVFQPFVEELSKILFPPEKPVRITQPLPEKEQKRIESLKRENSKLLKKSNDLNERLRKSLQREQKLNSIIKDTDKDKRKLSDDLKDALSTIENLKNRLEEAAAEEKRNLAKIESIKVSKASTIQTHSKIKAQYKAKVHALEATNAELRQELHNSNKKIISLKESGLVDKKEEFSQSLENTTSLPVYKHTHRMTLSEMISYHLGENEKIILLIDGHNVINSGQGYVEKQSAGMTHEELRNCFVKDVCYLQKKISPCEIRVYFDAPNTSEQTINQDVRIFYSGGTGEHRADTRIIKYVFFIKNVSGEVLPLITVTDDCDLRFQVSENNSFLLHVSEFISLL